MSEMRTGWVIKDRSDGQYFNEDSGKFCDISDATVWSSITLAAEVLGNDQAFFMLGDCVVVKVEWQPKVVQEVGR